MTRTRWGLAASSSFKLKAPLASVWVRPDSSIPCDRLRSTTSSPAAGLLVVPFVTLPIIVWADAEVRSRVHSKTRKIPHFSQSSREMGHPVSRSPVLRQIADRGIFKLWLLFGRAVTDWPPLLPGAQSQPELRLLPLRETTSWSGSRNPETCQL